MSETIKDTQVNLVLPSLNVSSRKQAFQVLAEEASESLMCSARTLYDRLMDKEKYASSGIGEGVAIPHTKLAQLKNPFSVLATFKKPIAFEALDGAPVDLVFMLLSPEKDGPLHLRRLSRVSRILQSRSLCEKIRETDDADTVRALLNAPEGWMMAA